MGGLGSNPVVGTGYYSHQPTQLSIHSGSVNEYPGPSFSIVNLGASKP